MRFKWIKILAVLAAAAGLIAVLFFAVKTKKLQVNHWLVSENDVVGVDLSEYQAEVDMEALAGQNIQFIYMKATEGSSYSDSRFRQNWENAEAAGIPAGAYHFFSFDSPGKQQAVNYVNTVGDLKGKLIPAVDVEFYAGKRDDPPPAEEVAALLHPGLEQIVALHISENNNTFGIPKRTIQAVLDEHGHGAQVRSALPHTPMKIC